MHKKKRKASLWERYLSAEIGIEFKACLYFYCILFFYSLYRIANGSFEAGIVHMAEMIALTYVMGYVQVYLLSNFDEGEHLKGKEVCYITICSLIYAGISYLGSWFDKTLAVSIGFLFYMMFAYVCAFGVYKIKRNIDERLNDDLKAFQERTGGKNEESN